MGTWEIYGDITDKDGFAIHRGVSLVVNVSRRSHGIIVESSNGFIGLPVTFQGRKPGINNRLQIVGEEYTRFIDVNSAVKIKREP